MQMKGFWVFMLVMALLLPLSMMLFGYLFYYKTPKTINGVYGYRTKMSRKNQQTWEFAHKYCGKIWMLIGTAMLPLSIGCMKRVVDADVDTIGNWSGVLVSVQCVLMILTIPLTERALRKNFTKNGIRKE